MHISKNSCIFALAKQKNNRLMNNSEFFFKLREISRKLHKLQCNMLRETKVQNKELEDRLKKQLTREKAIKHYNEWMKKEHLEHLMIKL